MKKKSGPQQKGHFSHPGQKGWCLSTTRGLSVHMPELTYIWQMEAVCTPLACQFLLTTLPPDPRWRDRVVTEEESPPSRS